MIFYEAPHHLRQSLEFLRDGLGKRRIALGRELTKRYEEMLFMELTEAVEYYTVNEPRGEYVLILEGADPEEMSQEERQRWEELSFTEHMERYHDLPPKEAMKQVARDRGISKRDVYSALLKEQT